MKILAVESSAKACSVALVQGDQLVAQVMQNKGLTHSKTLLPMIVSLLEQSETCLQDMDVLAVGVGPGSFTGLRIGVSTVKGLSFATKIPCAPCSTLESMAWQLSHLEGYTILSVMDARRNQVYHSRFLIKNRRPQRLTPDGAVDLEELAKEVEGIPGPKMLVGDGSALASSFLMSVEGPPAHLAQQQAWGVAQVGRGLAEAGELVLGNNLQPVYHRLSQAERQRLELLSKNTLQ